MTNFEFMKSESELYGIIRSAEDNLFMDPDTCLYKLRKYVNELAKKILQTTSVMPRNVDSLSDLLILLKNKNLLSNTSVNKMQEIRRAGNSSVHNNIFSTQEAEKMLANAFDISNEYILKYRDPIFKPGQYVYWRYEDVTAINEDKNSICTKEEAEFYNVAMNFLNFAIQRQIVMKRLDGFGSTLEIKTLTFAEYYTYYKDTIQDLVNQHRDYMMLIIELKDLIVDKTYLQRGEQCDREIALRLYVRTHWGDTYAE